MNDLTIGVCPCGGDLVVQLRFKKPVDGRWFDQALRVPVVACVECGSVEEAVAA